MIQTVELEEWATPCDDETLLHREIAAWEAASDEDVLSIEKVLAEMQATERWLDLP